MDNCSNQYVLVRTEDVGYVIIAPHKTYTGENVIGLNGKNNENIDNGKIDGIIFSSGKIQKITDDSRDPFNVDIRILPNENDLCAIPMSIRDLILNAVGDLLKLLFTNRDDYSGPDFIGSGTTAGNWIKIAPSQNTLKKIIGNNDFMFISHNEESILENVNNENK